MKYYVFFGGIDPLFTTRIATASSDRAAASAVERMGLGVLLEKGVELVDVYGEIGAVVGRADEKAVAELRKLGLRVEENRAVRAVGAPWNHEIIDLKAARERGLTGKGIKIAVLDTGIDKEACGLEGKVAYSTSFIPGEGAEDLHGHGTHVASIAASADDKYGGVAPGAQLYNIKVLNRYGEGDVVTVARGIAAAVSAGVDVINMSLGGPGHKDDLLSRLTNLAVMRGVVVAVAAGNEGPGEGTITSPGTAALAITVGAATRRKKVARYSSRGPVDDMMKPEVVAPGGDAVKDLEEAIIASRPKTARPACPPVGDCYMACVGTSMAAPHVAGTAALLLEGLRGASAAAEHKPQFVKRVLMETAEDLGEPKNAQGAGLIRVDKAVERAVSQPGHAALTASSLAAGLFGVFLAALGVLTAVSSNQRVSQLAASYRSGRITLAELVELYRRGVITWDELNKVLKG